MTHSAEEFQVFPDSEHVKEDVMLWAQAKILTHFVQVVTYVVVTNHSITRAGLEETCATARQLTVFSEKRFNAARM